MKGPKGLPHNLADDGVSLVRKGQEGLFKSCRRDPLLPQDTPTLQPVTGVHETRLPVMPAGFTWAAASAEAAAVVCPGAVRPSGSSVAALAPAAATGLASVLRGLGSVAA